MGQSLSEMGSNKKQIQDVIEVVRHGDQLVIPEALDLPRVDKIIHAKMEYDNQEFIPVADIDAPFVHEAAYALFKVLENEFGWANSVPTPGFFGPNPPAMLEVPIAPGQTVAVPWGRFKLPNIGDDGYLQSGVTEKDDGRLVFQITGKVRRTYEPVVKELVEKVKDYVRHHSIYRGTAFRVKLTDSRGEPLPMPEPEFLELDYRVVDELVLPAKTALQVQTNVFTPIEQTPRVIKHGIPLKRGILLAGPFGTGKTMIATATAVRAVKNGWTYVEAKDIRELAEVVRLARQYGDKEHGVVLFCEDIDRLMRGDDRSIGIDEVLNVVDGVESKGTSLMIVLTTNELEKITTALLRPGRLDAVIHVGPPDEEAAIALARQYGRGLIPADDELTESRKWLANRIPAVIREIVERSKLAAINLTEDDGDLVVNDDALTFAAQEMEEHIALLTPKPEDRRSETVKAADAIAKAILTASENTVIVPATFPITPPALVPGSPERWDDEARHTSARDATPADGDQYRKVLPESISETAN
jgi:ATPase family protein associated with various cellular activities (AAA)